MADEAKDDFTYEEEVARNPYSIRNWWSYIQAKRDAPTRTRVLIYERALQSLPGCYKIWRDYLLFRRQKVRARCITHRSWDILNKVYERALVFMHKMPVVWLDYLQVLMDQKFATRTRHAFDLALQSLPVTQHARVWALYTKFVKELGVWQTAVKVYRRYITFDPAYREEYTAYLLSIDHFDEAAKQISTMVNDDAFVSLKGTSKHAMWLQLCDIISKHPHKVTSIPVEQVIRAGIRRFTDEVGRLWHALADYFIRLGQFEKARDVYEEAIQSVLTVRDFSIVFDAYAMYEDSMLTAKIQLRGEDGDGDSKGVADDGDDDLVLLEDGADDVDLRLARLEALIESRPVLLSSVMLRQNPHNVHEWHKRVKLFEDQPHKAILAFTEAVKTVDAFKATGKPHTLWVEFAKLYEKQGELEQARVVFKKATEAVFKSIEDLASVWCEWAEMEIRNNKYQEALRVMQQAVADPPRRARDIKYSDLPNQDKVHKNLRVWSLYIDLEESLGTLETTKAAYNRAIDLKVATPQMVINFATYLEDKGFFEDSFKAYERGVALFSFPHVKDIWLAYLTKFVERYKSRKLERARELYEQAIEKVPAADAIVFFLMYAKLEEEHGLTRHAMSIYDRATKAVDDSHRMEMFLRYVAKVEEFYGITKTRDIYEKSIEVLPDKEAKDMCLRYAAMEKKLGEVDRARAIFVHGSQMCDPRTEPEYWEEWHKFEVAHGNEDTFREMLRVKRSVVQQFALVNVATEALLKQAAELQERQQKAKEAAEQHLAGAAAGMAPAAPESKKRERTEALADDVEDDPNVYAAIPFSRGPQKLADVEEMAVPEAVFGEARDALQREQRGENVGALGLFKRRRQDEE